MLIPSGRLGGPAFGASLSRRVNANSQLNKANEILGGQAYQEG